MNNEAYVKEKLEEAAKSPVRGTLVRIARESKCDPRTVRSILRGEHSTHISTIDKLAAHFKKLDKKSAKEEEVKA